jgi:serine/threonine-protein kinase
MPEQLPFFGPDLRGRLLDGRYRLESVVGSGGSGTVYAARDVRLKRRVAVKVIHPEHARLEEQRRRIRQEALVGAQISHPNVAPILDFNAEADERGEQRMFIVMPLLEGRSLREAILDGPLPWVTACLWTRQLLAGLSALHRSGVLHRDVKSDNCVLVREGGREVLKLLDLGLAKVTRAP